MIHLDTNYLIGLLVQGSPQALETDGWLGAGQQLGASAIAWTELSCNREMLRRSPQRSSIYIDILKSSSGWAAQQGAA